MILLPEIQIQRDPIGQIKLSRKLNLIGCANSSQQTPHLWYINILGCCPLAFPTEWIMPSKVSKSLRNTELPNSYQLDSWWVFCPDSCFWMQ